MKLLVFSILISSILLTSCSRAIYDDGDVQVVSIYGSQDRIHENFFGMGLQTDSYILTSAHVVSDERLRYSIRSGNDIIPITLIEKDTTSDRAVLGIGENTMRQSGVLYDFFSDLRDIRIGDPIYTIVARSGSLLRLDGSILKKNEKILGYTTSGQTYMLSGVTITDLMVLPGDSGAPIFSRDRGELIDVVHMARK